MKTSLVLQHATWFTQELYIPSDFSLHFKATMTMTIDQVLRG